MSKKIYVITTLILLIILSSCSRKNQDYNSLGALSEIGSTVEQKNKETLTATPTITSTAAPTTILNHLEIYSLN